MKNKQYVINKFSESIELASNLQEVDLKPLANDEIRIKNNYVGINALYDRELYKGNVPYINVNFPYVFGVEAVGEVVDLGKDIKEFKIGDAVGTVKVGTAYQEYQSQKVEDIIKFPKASAEYLALSPTGVSAYLALELVAEIKEGETVVVSAAAGGLGHLLVQLCYLKKCKVVAICGSSEKKQFLESLNVCELVINYKDEDVYDLLNEKYNGKINVGIDSVGREIFDVLLKNLAPLGRLIVIGLAAELSDSSFEIIKRARVYESMYWKGASVRCFMNHLYKDKHAWARKKLFRLYQNGDLKVKVDDTSFQGIASIVEASKYLLAGKSCGKVVVRL